MSNRPLEQHLDRDVIGMASMLKMSDDTGSFKTTRGAIQSLQSAKEYRTKFPGKSADPATDQRVNEALSYLDKKEGRRP